MNQLNDQIIRALDMKEDEIIYMRENVLKFYEQNLSPESFKLKFINNLDLKNREIICCDDHRSVEKMNNQ